MRPIGRALCALLISAVLICYCRSSCGTPCRPSAFLPLPHLHGFPNEVLKLFSLAAYCLCLHPADSVGTPQGECGLIGRALCALLISVVLICYCRSSGYGATGPQLAVGTKNVFGLAVRHALTVQAWPLAKMRIVMQIHLINTTFGKHKNVESVANLKKFLSLQRRNRHRASFWPFCIQLEYNAKR